MNKQDQEVGEGSVGIQSEGDTVAVIQQGVTADQMREIMDSLARQIPVYVAAGMEAGAARIKELENRLIDRFEKDQDAKPEAFKDPDFQHMVYRGQQAYARSGDANIADILVDLIAERSKLEDRSRLSLSLNDAVEKAAVLTRNEFAELSLSFIVRRTKSNRVHDRSSFIAYFKQFISPFLPDIEEGESSYLYLQSHGCASISLGQLDYYQGVFRKLYGGIFSRGFERPTLESHLPDGKKNILDGTILIRPCLNDEEKFQINAIDWDIFIKRAEDEKVDLTEAQLKNVWVMNENHFFNENEFIDFVKNDLPEIEQFDKLWNRTPLKRLNLTSLGIAIGHANAKRVGDLDADLNIWIK